MHANRHHHLPQCLFDYRIQIVHLADRINIKTIVLYYFINFLTKSSLYFRIRGQKVEDET